MHSREVPIIHGSLDPCNVELDIFDVPQIYELGPGRVASCTSTIEPLQAMQAFRPDDAEPSKGGDVYSLAWIIFFVSTPILATVDNDNSGRLT